VMKPMYAGTLAFTRMRDVGTAEEALLKAIFMSPGTIRGLAYTMLASLPTLMSPVEHGQTQFIGKMFAPAPEATES